MADRAVEPIGESRLRPFKRPDGAERPMTKWGELASVLDRHRGKHLLILLTGYPDPDNIGSGLALQLLARRFGIESTLLTFHEVSHQQNRALVKRLEVELVLYDERFDVEPYELYAFVDTQKLETPIQDELKDKT